MNWITGSHDYYCADYMKGMVSAFPGRWRLIVEERNSAVLARTCPPNERPALIISGGGANGPLFPGYVCEGLADAAAVGGPYSAPTAYALYEAARQLDCGHGVLLLYNNFSGDFLNNDMAEELCAMSGIPTKSVVVCDDIASALGEDRCERSGRTGIAVLARLASACFGRGCSLEETAEMLEEAKKGLATLSVRVDVPSNRVYYGEGISGEPGIAEEEGRGLRDVAIKCIDMLIDDILPDSKSQLFLLINRMRLTSYSDSFMMTRYASEYLESRYNLWRVRVGNFSNITDIYGFDFTIAALDGEMRALLKNDVQTDCFII